MKVIKDIIKTLYNSGLKGVFFALGISLLVLAIEIYKKEDIKGFIREKIYGGRCVWRFILYFYSYLILYETLFSREKMWDGLGDVMGGWHNTVLGNGTVLYEPIENILMFIPLTFLVFMSFGDNVKKKKYRMVRSIFFSLVASLFIEVNQIIFNLGTFQIADLFYNTLGGFMGYVLYRFCIFIYKKKRNITVR